MTRIYLDYNATTPVCDEAVEAYTASARLCGNASSVHLDGQSARHRLETAREGLAALWGASPQEIVFTSGATEANNLAVKGIARHAAKSGKRHVLVGATEHPSVLDAAHALQSESFDVEVLPVSRACRVAAEEVRRRLRPQTALVAVMAANNETGAVQPLEAIAQACAEAGAALHVDWVQGLGKIPVNLTGCSTASFSAHKAYGPKGIGALFVSRKTKLSALLHGGPQENNVRAGTESPELALAFLAAARSVESARAAETKRSVELKAEFLNHLSLLTGDWMPTLGASEGLTQTIHLLIGGVRGDALVTAMDLAGFSLSSGSACAAGSVEASHVLLAMGIPPESAAGAVRISFGRQTTREELLGCAEALAREAERLRKKK